MILNSTRWAMAIISTFSNFPSIYLSKISKRIPEQLSTWSGYRFKVMNINSNLGTILEVWHGRVYGDLSELSTEEAPVVIDIGANIGAFTVFATHMLKHPKIYAFEPETNNFNLLQANIEINGLIGNVIACKQAVYGKEGKIFLSIAGESSGKNSIELDQCQGKGEEVECVTLDLIFKKNSIKTCDLLKIDCEGSEYELLLNAKMETLSKVRMMILEWHNVPGHTLEELTEFLKSSGFIVERSKDHYSTLIARRKSA